MVTTNQIIKRLGIKGREASGLILEAESTFFRRTTSLNGRYDERKGQRRHRKSGDRVPRYGIRHYVAEALQRSVLGLRDSGYPI